MNLIPGIYLPQLTSILGRAWKLRKQKFHRELVPLFVKQIFPSKVKFTQPTLRVAISSSFPPLNHVKYRRVHRKLPDRMPSHKKFCSALFPCTGFMTMILTWSANQTFRVSESFSHDSIGNRSKLTGKFYIFHAFISSVLSGNFYLFVFHQSVGIAPNSCQFD